MKYFNEVLGEPTFEAVEINKKLSEDYAKLRSHMLEITDCSKGRHVWNDWRLKEGTIKRSIFHKREKSIIQYRQCHICGYYQAEVI